MRDRVLVFIGLFCAFLAFLFSVIGLGHYLVGRDPPIYWGWAFLLFLVAFFINLYFEKRK